ncbi:MAG: phage/plasmid primase, family [Phycisphaerales bacterium]|nr:phage/plasmid primase, family [Phycisphaerales bacterium]
MIALSKLGSWRIDEYHSWVKVGMTLHSVDSSSTMCSTWDQWSSHSQKYVAGECARRWSSYGERAKAIKLGTLIKWAQEDAGVKDIFTDPTANDRQRAKDQARAAVEDDEDVVNPADEEQSPKVVALGECDPNTGRVVLNPRRTLPTAEAFTRDHYSHPLGRTIHYYASLPFAWNGNRYVETEDAALRHQLQSYLHHALRYIKKADEMELVDFESNPTTVKAALDSTHDLTHLPAHLTPPFFLNRKHPDLDPHDLLAFPSGLLHLPTRKILSPDPNLFNINAIDFDYDPNAPQPERFIDFLGELWEDDFDSVQTLQEWFGYVLTADTRLQKMLMLVGPKRSGKGTLGRVLRRLIGEGNVCGPTTSSLAETFGLQALIGKSLAMVSDARFSGEHASTVIERLLCISGEDSLTIDRKFLPSITMKLLTRMMFLTNELPRMNDASGALAGRFIILKLTRSLYDREDPNLTDTLMGELPGILLWALDRYRRLNTRGYFVQPKSGAQAVEEMLDLASPVAAFVREWCKIGNDLKTPTDDLFEAWLLACKEQGARPTDKPAFGRDLRAAFPALSVVECREGGRHRRYQGIGLTLAAEESVKVARNAKYDRERTYG